MRIGLLIDDSFDYPDGVQQYAKTVGRWLVKQGHSVAYIASSSQADDVPVTSLTKNIRVSFNGNVVRTPLPITLRKASSFARTNQLDVLHVQMPYSPFFAGKLIRAYKNRGTRIVGTFHIVPFAKTDIYAAKLQRYTLRSTLPLFDEVCSVSKAAQSFAFDTFGIHSSVVPNAVDIDRFRQASIDTVHSKTTITFLGRLVERKGCRHLLEAISRVISSHPTLRKGLIVRIGGSGHLEASLRARSRELGIDDIVQFDGFIDEKKKAAYLAESDIAVFPSLGGESFGIVVVEALATGSCVVLAANNPGYAGVMGGLKRQLFDPNDTNSFSDVLHAYIAYSKDADKKKQILDAQSKVASVYDTDAVGRQLIRLYES